MDLREPFSDVIAGLAASRLVPRRVIGRYSPFEMHLRTDFLTPDGAPYKWQEIQARLGRTAAHARAPGLVPVRYTWHKVYAMTGVPGAEAAHREWTFARGQAFGSVLLHSEVGPSRPDGGSDRPGAVPDQPQTGHLPADPGVDQPAAFDVCYPDLPKAPAVDLLLVLSWDVVTFEMICSQVATSTGLGETGVPADIDRLSGTWATLSFSDPAVNAVFQNSTMTAMKLGYGVIAGRPVASYGFRCLDCKLISGGRTAAQRGHSSYWGTLHVDMGTGDLVTGEFTEMIVALLVGMGSKPTAIQRRRRVSIRAEAAEYGWAPLHDTAGRSAGHFPVGATGSQIAGRSRPAEPGGSPPASNREPAALTDKALLDDAIGTVKNVEMYVRAHTDTLDYLPDGLGPLASMGFESLVGNSPHVQLRRLRALQAELMDWKCGDIGAASGVYAGISSYRMELEGIIAYCEMATSQIDRLRIRDPATVQTIRMRMTTLRDELGRLCAMIDRLEAAHAAAARGSTA